MHPQRENAGANEVLHERGLQRELEGRDGAKWMMLEGCFKMSEREFGGVLRRDIGRSTHGVDRRAYRTLGFVESLPDAVGCRITQFAGKTSESLHFVAAGRRLFEECPQGISSQEQSPDLVGQPNAKGSSTAGRPMTIATENAVCADRVVMLMSFVVATQNPMTDQISHTFTMRTSRCLELFEHCGNFLLSGTNLPAHNHPSAPESK